MKVGLIVDGQSEFQAFKSFKTKLEEETGAQIIGPLLADLQPSAKATKIAAAASTRLTILEKKKVEVVIIAIDLDSDTLCPITLADSISAAVAGRASIPVEVVVKNRCFENWLVADVEALRAQTARFSVSDSAARNIMPNKADNVDALKFLVAAANNSQYHKVTDSQRILERAEVARMAAHSRSFRKLLRCLGHPDFSTSSRNPV